MYDPGICDVVRESQDRDRFVVCSYYVEDTLEAVDVIDPLGQVK